MAAFKLALLLVGIILFLVAAFGVPTGRFSLLAAGLAAVWASTLPL